MLRLARAAEAAYPGHLGYARPVGRKAMLPRRVIVALACVALGAACTLFNPLDEYGPPEPKADASTTETGGDTPGDSCKKERWPERPEADDATDDIELFFALETLKVGPELDAGTPDTTGFDLDGVCTCPGPPSCISPDAGTKCDLDGGIDDEGTKLLVSLASLGRVGNDTSDRLRAGATGLILRLAHYNGGLDDTQVEFSVFLSLGTETDDAGEPKPPRHDGNDRWTVDRASLIGRNGPPYIPEFVDPDAYVSGGTLVTKIGFPLQLGALVLNLTEGVAVARVVRQGSSYRLEGGRLAGRLPTRKLLTVLDSIADPFSPDGGGVCGDSSLYAELKKRICSAVDIVADPAQDNTSAACDALGSTLLFTAEPAQPGAVVDRPPTIHLCGPDWADDCQR